MKIRNLLKKNIKIIIAFVIGLIISGSGVYAATVASSDVSYTNNSQSTVQGAIDDLYNKAKTPEFVEKGLIYYDECKRSYNSRSYMTMGDLCSTCNGTCSECSGWTSCCQTTSRCAKTSIWNNQEISTCISVCMGSWRDFI